MVFTEYSNVNNLILAYPERYYNEYEKLTSFYDMLIDLIPNEIQLWLGDLEQKLAKQLSNITLNDTYGRLYQWAPDSKSLLVKCVAPQKAVPKRSIIPGGPNTQEIT